MSKYLEKIRENILTEDYDLPYDNLTSEFILINLNRSLLKGTKDYDLNIEYLQSLINDLKNKRINHYNNIEIDIEHLDKKYKEFRENEKLLYNKFFDFYLEKNYKDANIELKAIEKREDEISKYNDKGDYYYDEEQYYETE